MTPDRDLHEMAKDDYTSTGGGLKLKGAKNAGISKHKKKKKAKPAAETSADITGVSERSGSRGAAERPMDEDRVEEVGDEEERGKSSADVKERSRSRSPDASMGPAAASGGVGKTDAERRHEEMRRKRVCASPLPFAWQRICTMCTSARSKPDIETSYPNASPAKAQRRIRSVWRS